MINMTQQPSTAHHMHASMHAKHKLPCIPTMSSASASETIPKLAVENLSAVSRYGAGEERCVCKSNADRNVREDCGFDPYASEFFLSIR
jgi:hypothetical protein